MSGNSRRIAIVICCSAVALALVWLVFRGMGGDFCSDATPGTTRPAFTDDLRHSPTANAQPVVSRPDPLIADNLGWVPVQPSAVKGKSVPSAPDVQDSVLVELSSNIGAWEKGETITLAVPQTGASYVTTIDEVKTGFGRNRSYSGRTVQGELPHSFLITVGRDKAFAYLGTPEGSFELYGNAELAWLMPSANMDRQVDYTRPDYILPEQLGDLLQVIPHQRD